MPEWNVPVGSEPMIFHTGIWRTQRPKLQAGACTSCGACFLYCPTGSVRREGESYVTDYDYCKGCGICVEVCLDGARRLVAEGSE